MPGYKLIAVDLDDTLLNDRLEVTPRTRLALGQAHGAGVVITLATGRMYRSALPFTLDLGIEVPIITYQGALVKNACSGEVLLERLVPLDRAREVLAEGYEAGVHINLYLDDTLFVDSITPEGAGYAELAGVEMHPVGNLLAFLDREPAKILFIAEPDLLDGLRDRLRAKFADSLYITKSKPRYLEFMHPGATKGRALEALAEKLGCAASEVMAIGDSYNDLDMFRYAGMAVAMGNAPGEVKERAGYVTDTNNCDGVAKALEELVLNNLK